MHTEVALIVNLLISCVCCLTTALPGFTRHLNKNGLHRDLVTILTIPDSLLQEHGTDVICFTMFVETIPSGAYVDPYQLHNLKSHGGPDVLITSPIDLEKPEFQSKEIPVKVFSNLSQSDGAWVAQYTLPIHLRYHAISADADYTTLELLRPEVAVRCQMKDYGMQYFGYKGDTIRQERHPCTSENKVLCEWVFINVNTGEDVIRVQVPVGKSEHRLLVAAGTILTTVAGCAILVIKSVMANSAKTTKIS